MLLDESSEECLLFLFPESGVELELNLDLQGFGFGAGTVECASGALSVLVAERITIGRNLGTELRKKPPLKIAVVCKSMSEEEEYNG